MPIVRRCTPVDDRDGERRGSGTLLCMIETLKKRVAAVLAAERGDVPGWVLITLMTAGLVILIWALAGPALSEIFQNAIAKVTGL